MADAAELSFEDLSFKKEGDHVKVTFLKIFFFHIPLQDITSIGDPEINERNIVLKGVSQVKAEKRFNVLLAKGFGSLKNSINSRDAVYVHKNSGIPLMGTIYFGIVDKGSDMLEVKPITGCNLDCVFCSVGEGSKDNLVDFVVEKDYLIQEVRSLLNHKMEKADIYINPHGEPLLYSDLAGLVRGLRQIDLVRRIILITNGTLLTKNKVDELVDAGVDSFNISLNALSQEKAEELAGTSAINIKKLKDVCKYIAGRKNNGGKSMLILTPVFMSGLNEDELIALGKFADEVGAELITQNFLSYNRGKKPAEEMSFEEFYSKMDQLSKKHDICLVKPLPKTVKTKELQSPFRRNQVIEAEIACKGRHKNELIASAEGRAISVVGCNKPSGNVKVRILKSAHNIFFGECL